MIGPGLQFLSVSAQHDHLKSLKFELTYLYNLFCAGFDVRSREREHDDVEEFFWADELVVGEAEALDQLVYLAFHLTLQAL